jgi:hypothetical protein
MLGDEVQEELMDSRIGGEFRMEGGGEQMARADEDWKFVAAGKSLYTGAGTGDAGSSDEDHLQRPAWEGGLRGEDGGIDLAAVGIAFDGDVEGCEGLLGGVQDFGGEQDGPGAGAEGWGGGDKVFKDLSIVVDSPPGIMRPATPVRSSGVRTSLGVAPSLRRVLAWASYAPWRARTPMVSACIVMDSLA